MKGLKLRAALLFLSLSAVADEGTDFATFRDRRRAEEQLHVTSLRGDLEEGERLARLQAATAAVKKAEAAGHLVPAARKDPAAVDFLSRRYLREAREWAPFDWQCAAEWFGQANADSFLKLVFAMEEAPTAAKTAGNAPRVLWVRDPLERFLDHASATRARAEHAAEKASLTRRGYAVEELEVHAFSRVEEQAEELHLALTAQAAKSPFTLLSSGHASAVVLRAFEQNPALLVSHKIAGWVNVDGRLFGRLPEIARSPASVRKPDRQRADADRELLLLRGERLAKQTPLGARFPVVNLVSLSGPGRAEGTPRDSLVPDARTLFVPQAGAPGRVGDVLPLLLTGPQASGQRDPASDADF